jgi:hypothetical protein
MKKRIASFGTLGLLALLVASAAGAQISSDPPTLQGEPSVHAWTVPGVISNSAMGTAMTCTNTLGSTVIVGVELFDAAGTSPLNGASATSVSVAPGATAVFTSNAMVAFAADMNIGEFVSKGSARILTTTSVKASQSILCSAILADPYNNPPAVMTSLPVIKKTTQQGD